MWPIYKFFKELGYPKVGSSHSALVDLTDIAAGFRRCMETRLPGIKEVEFKNQFERSISKHCSLVDETELFKKRVFAP